MDDGRVAKEFKRIQTIAVLDKEREILASYHEGLAKAWIRVGRARYDLGNLDFQLGDENEHR